MIIIKIWLFTPQHGLSWKEAEGFLKKLTLHHPTPNSAPSNQKKYITSENSLDVKKTARNCQGNKDWKRPTFSIVFVLAPPPLPSRNDGK